MEGRANLLLDATVKIGRTGRLRAAPQAHQSHHKEQNSSIHEHYKPPYLQGHGWLDYRMPEHKAYSKTGVARRQDSLKIGYFVRFRTSTGRTAFIEPLRKPSRSSVT